MMSGWGILEKVTGEIKIPFTNIFYSCADFR